MLVEIKVTPAIGGMAGRYRPLVLDFAFGTGDVPECEVISVLMAAVARIQASITAVHVHGTLGEAVAAGFDAGLSA